MTTYETTLIDGDMKPIGHQVVHLIDGDFTMHSYPDGRKCDICRGRPRFWKKGAGC